MTRILIVGDTHGNAPWFRAAVAPVAQHLEVDLVVQVGDYGYWPHHRRNPKIMDECDDLFAATGISTWFCDGNHENHPALGCAVLAARSVGATTPVPLTPGTAYLPRGCRFEFDGCRIAVIGGAHSIDRGLRTEGVGWFPAERITSADLDLLAAGGPAHVLISHDAPSGYPIPGINDVNIPSVWRQELAACNSHRHLVRFAMEAVTPRVLVHGHYHQHYHRTLAEPWGDVFVQGLAGEGQAGALTLLTLNDGYAQLSDVRPAE